MIMASIGVFEIFLATISFLLFTYLSKRHESPKNLPLFGMLPELLLNAHRIHDWCTEVLQRYQCTFLFEGPWFAKLNILVTSDPANINYIMSSNFSNFPKGSEFKEIFDILGDGIFNADSDSWMSQRRAAQLLLKHQLFLRFLVKTGHSKVSKGLIPILDHASSRGLVVDLQDLFQRFTFDSSCMFLTGYDPKSLSLEYPEVPFAKALDDAEDAIFYRHIKPQSFTKLQKLLNVGEEKKLKQAWEIIDQTIEEYMCWKKEELNKRLDDEEGADLLTSYMTKGEVMGLESNEKFLRDTILNLMLAGRDTTSSALTWFFFLVSTNPQVEKKIIEELKTKVPVEGTESWRLFDIEEVKNLVYLQGALCEALRLYPPVPFQHKVPLQQDTLPSGHPVTPGVKIVFSLYAMARMKSVWGEDCLDFKPERWISDKGRIKYEPASKFLSFNAGPRTCLGKEVAFIQMKAVAAAIIYNYRIHLVEGHPIVPRTSIILHMKHGLKVKVSSRWA